MRDRPTILLATVALVLCFGSTSARAAARADDAPLPSVGGAATEASSAEVAKLSVDPDLRDQRRLSVIFRRPGMLGADGHLQWLLGTQERAGLASPLLVVSADPAGGSFDASVLEGSTKRRHEWRESRGGTIAGVSAAEGGNWFIDRPIGPPPTRNALVRFDDRFRVVERRPAPKGIIRFTSMVATARGVVGVGMETRVAKGLQGVNDGVLLTSPVLVAGRRVFRQRTLQDVRAAVALDDGSVLLTGASAYGGADRVVVIHPDGTIVRPADRRGRNLPESSGRAGVVATRYGVVMDERSSPSSGPDVPDDPKSVLLLRGKDGRVLVRRKLADLDYPKPAGCAIAQERRRLASIGVGPDGLPLIRLTCSAPVSTFPDGTSASSYRDVGTTMIGLTAELRPRWYRRADADMQPRDAAEHPPVSLCASDSTGVDGRLLTVACDGRVTATTVPDALPVGLGEVVRTRRATGRDALVRIACDGPQGAMCAGRLQIWAADRLRGTASYVVPARPGRARGTVDRRVDTPSALPARFEARLIPPR